MKRYIWSSITPPEFTKSTPEQKALAVYMLRKFSSYDYTLLGVEMMRLFIERYQAWMKIYRSPNRIQVDTLVALVDIKRQLEEWDKLFKKKSPLSFRLFTKAANQFESSILNRATEYGGEFSEIGGVSFGYGEGDFLIARKAIELTRRSRIIKFTLLPNLINPLAGAVALPPPDKILPLPSLTNTLIQTGDRVPQSGIYLPIPDLGNCPAILLEGEEAPETRLASDIGILTEVEDEPDEEEEEEDDDDEVDEQDDDEKSAVDSSTDEEDSGKPLYDFISKSQPTKWLLLDADISCLYTPNEDEDFKKINGILEPLEKGK